MAVLVFYGESLYFKDSHNKLTNETEATIRRLLLENNGVGIIGGYYDRGLPICMVSELAVQKFLSFAPETYQVVLMDIMMPKLDGLKATEWIRHSSHEQAQEIPIIAMTANAFAEDVEKSLAVGMNAHLVKPIDIDKLLRMVQDYGKRIY